MYLAKYNNITYKHIYILVYINNHDIGIRNATHTPPKLAGQTTGIRCQWQKQCKKSFFILHTCYIERKILVGMAMIYLVCVVLGKENNSKT